MKRLLLFLFFTLVAQWVCSAQAVPKISKEEQEVRAAVKEWAEAMVSRDMSVLDKLFADDLFITAYDGSTRGKKEELEGLEPSPDVKTLSVENEELRVRIYNRSAVVTAIVRMRFEIGGKQTQAAFRYTAVFVKKDGRRQIAVLQTTRIAQPARETGV
jgi:ketosteroid isomerase-like protein